MKNRSLPRHVGIIMDGNGRWAELRGLPRFEGHKRGVERVSEIVNVACSAGIEALSLYAFSIENWSRPEDEVGVIMNLLQSSLVNDLPAFMENGVRFRVIGDRERLSRPLRELIVHTEEVTASNDRLSLQCALSYGGRDEIVRAVRRLVSEGYAAEEITEELIGSRLDTAGVADPDLIIRTSGEQRVSNFLLWQSAYSEFYFTPTLWPDFTKEEFLEALYQYKLRDRRFGKVQQVIDPCI